MDCSNGGGLDFDFSLIAIATARSTKDKLTVEAGSILET